MARIWLIDLESVETRESEVAQALRSLINNPSLYEEADSEQSQSQLDGDNPDITYSVLKNNLEKDIRYQYTTNGIHKDDMLFTINEFSVKKFGSQGQQKTFLIALKLAQFDYLSRLKTNPILLLDDIFDKLDDYRVMQIINLVNDDSFGQLFVTDTNKERTENIIKQTAQSYSMFSL